MERVSTPDDLEQLGWMFFSALRRIGRNLDIYSRELDREFGLTLPQLDVLWAVDLLGDVPIGQVAERVHLSKPTLTSITDRLVAHELIERIRSDEDKRRVIVSLTPKGRALLAENPQPFSERFLTSLREMDEWQRTHLLAELQHLAGMMEPADDATREPSA